MRYLFQQDTYLSVRKNKMFEKKTELSSFPLSFVQKEEERRDRIYIYIKKKKGQTNFAGGWRYAKNR